MNEKRLTLDALERISQEIHRTDLVKSLEVSVEQGKISLHDAMMRTLGIGEASGASWAINQDLDEISEEW